MKSAARLATACLLVSLVGSLGCWGTVSGRVVDQYGEPVPDVYFHMGLAAANRFEMDAYAGERGALLADGRFRASCWTCSAVHLFFFRDGYYSEARDLAFYERKWGLEIVMQRAGRAVHLREYQGHLASGPDIADMVLVLDSQGLHERPHDEVVQGSKRLPYLALRPSLDDAGALLMKQGELIDAIGPASLDFAAAGPGSGIQPYEPTTRYVDRAYREMKSAPSDGYTSALELESGAPEQFFYCRIGFRYCKGRVTAPRLDHRRGGKRAVELSLELYLNSESSELSLEDPSRF